MLSTASYNAFAEIGMPIPLSTLAAGSLRMNRFSHFAGQGIESVANFFPVLPKEGTRIDVAPCRPDKPIGSEQAGRIAGVRAAIRSRPQLLSGFE